MLDTLLVCYPRVARTMSQSSGSKRCLASQTSLSGPPRSQRQRRVLSDITNTHSPEGSPDSAPAEFSFDPLEQEEPGQFESGFDLFSDQSDLPQDTRPGKEDCDRVLQAYEQQADAIKSLGEVQYS